MTPGASEFGFQSFARPPEADRIIGMRGSRHRVIGMRGPDGRATATRFFRRRRQVSSRQW
jgi:hypothetical protein